MQRAWSNFFWEGHGMTRQCRICLGKRTADSSRSLRGSKNARSANEERLWLRVDRCQLKKDRAVPCRNSQCTSRLQLRKASRPISGSIWNVLYYRLESVTGACVVKDAKLTFGVKAISSTLNFPFFQACIITQFPAQLRAVLE